MQKKTLPIQGQLTPSLFLSKVPKHSYLLLSLILPLYLGVSEALSEVHTVHD